MKGLIGISKEYICPQCGRLFYVPRQTRGGGKTEWVYVAVIRRKKYYLCTYSCYTQFKKQEGKKYYDGSYT